MKIFGSALHPGDVVIGLGDVDLAARVEVAGGE